MGNAVNYQRKLTEILKDHNDNGHIPRILLHACCAPCASSCMEVLDRFADITVFFYNPNITIKEEYEHRLSELKRLVGEMTFAHRVEVLEGEYDPELFFSMSKGLENEPERGARCLNCYRMRLGKTAQIAAEGGYDYFATTLTLSPLKPAQTINGIGMEISDIYLPSDFKKNNGYLRSIELSGQFNLYRQNYCGCVYSRRG